MLWGRNIVSLSLLSDEYDKQLRKRVDLLTLVAAHDVPLCSDLLDEDDTNQ